MLPILASRRGSFMAPEINSLFDSMVNPSITMSNNHGEVVWKPLVDVRESENVFLLDIALPGFTKKDISIEVTDNVLIISGERKHNETNNGVHYSYSEIPQGNFRRAFNLPKTVNQKNIAANFKNGVLEVSLPKEKPDIVNIKID